jgi:hypothetical protein
MPSDMMLVPTRRKTWFYFSWFIGTGLLLGCFLVSWARAQTSAAAPTFTFLRSAKVDGRLALQTRTVAYRPANGSGPTVLLVGVAHLGTPEYYAALQKRLDAETVVLFEGVHEKNMKMGKGAATVSGGVQPELAKGLGLVFQLDAIDYSRPNFVGSDMTWNGLQSAYNGTSAADSAAAEDDSGDSAPSAGSDDSAPAASPKSKTAATGNLMQQMTDAMSGEGAMAKTLQQFSGLMSSSSQMQETMKLVIIQTMGQAAELLNLAQTQSPEMKKLMTVLLTERNGIVMRDLKARLARMSSGQSIALFYGAGHMNELSSRLEKELGYRPVQEVWDTAFSADPAKSMLSETQVAMIVNMAKTQLQQSGGKVDDDALGMKDIQKLFSSPTPGASPAVSP